MGYWAKLAARAAFRKGNATYCGHINPVTPGMWAGGVVGLKSILGVKRKADAMDVLKQLAALGYVKYSLDPLTKKLTYEITDWVVKCSGAECMTGTVYATDGMASCVCPEASRSVFMSKSVFLMSQMPGSIFGVIRSLKTVGMLSHSSHRLFSTESMVLY